MLKRYLSAGFVKNEEQPLKNIPSMDALLTPFWSPLQTGMCIYMVYIRILKHYFESEVTLQYAGMNFTCKYLAPRIFNAKSYDRKK